MDFGSFYCLRMRKGGHAETNSIEHQFKSSIHEGGDFSVGHIVLDFDLKLLLCWTNAFGHTLLGSFVYVVICWAVEDTLCWAVGHWASVALCWAVIIICTLLGSFYCMESVGHVQQSYW